MRLIDADALKEIIEDHVTTVSVCPTVEWARGKTQMKLIALEDIDNAPTVEAEPARRGKWIKENNVLICSQCGFRLIGARPHYCQKCGAKMANDDD